ncbi:DEAD/DEAH box helicase [Corynebacterium frankenforstense]
MSSFSDAIAGLRTIDNKAKQGLAFEKLIVNFLCTDPELKTRFDKVYRWVDWPHNGGRADTGIDIVAHESDGSGWAAIQCKFYLPTTSLQQSHLDSFFSATGKTFTNADGNPEQYASRVVISTTDKWSKNAEALLEDQVIPTSRIGMADIEASPIDWDIAYPGSEIVIDLSPRETFEPRRHQQEAIDKVVAGFEHHDRGKLIMACGTGKTFTSLRLAEKVADNCGGRARVLFLVPSISLLSQTMKEWTAQGRTDQRIVAVCSDNKARKEAEDIASYDLSVPVTTDGAAIAEKLSQKKRAAGLTVVFSTYQSLPAVHEAQVLGADGFDLVVCDEAHRTTGVTLAGQDPSNFTRIHDASYIKADRRLYMTATPRLFDERTKGKAEEHSAEITSMDDESVFGPEFHRLGFGQAVEQGLLTDYRVVVMTVDESVAAGAMAAMNAAAGASGELTLDTASAMIGAWNGLAKRSGKEADHKGGFSSTDAPMRRAVAFAKDIRASKEIVEAFPGLVATYTRQLQVAADKDTPVDLHNIDVGVSARHVDGSMNALKRGNALTWLKATPEPGEVKVLSNARCLSEGVDVPALDAVVFFNPRNSMVDVVQSVGRVMRKSEGKDYGYIILPVAVPPGVEPAAALNDSRRFKVVWQILNALRAHDDRFNATVNSIQLNEGDATALPLDVEHVADPAKLILEGTEGDRPRDAVADGQDLATQMALFSLERWQEAIYTKLVAKVGTRTYWEDWADDVADIAAAQIERINALLDDASAKVKKEFRLFVEGLRGNLNDSITEDEAVSMLSQHLITAPVFDALFAEHEFAAHNPVAKVMNRMAQVLDDKKLDSETASLERFYDSVRTRASAVTSASGKQEVIRELYERFFRKAFRKQSEALGIVYTPVEIVDYILRAADELSKKYFGFGLTDSHVHVLDPFTGTGTFIVRLLQSGLIKPADLARKYARELHATEIMLLAYYVAAVNIETTFHGIQAERARRDGAGEPGYEPFGGIALADTFQITEDDDTLDGRVFIDNNDRIKAQLKAPIHVIVGNPPYSVGQNNANDFNANLKYPTLDRRIEQTYAKLSTGGRKSQLYDSYLRAFRWATDRLDANKAGDEAGGIVAFVSNGGWLDGNTADGVRLSFAEDFSDIYVFNLRGNQRTAGEKSRKEGGKVFGSGSRAGIAVTLAVKVPGVSGCRVHYRDIGDYLTAEEKLDIVAHSGVEGPGWREITPNRYGDWVNQRHDEFAEWPGVGARDSKSIGIFCDYSLGLNTARDVWCYNTDRTTVEKNVQTSVAFFNEESSRVSAAIRRGGDPGNLTVDSTKFKWDRVNKRDVKRGLQIHSDNDKIRRGLYRPFFPQHVYFDHEQRLNNCTYQLPSMFPTPEHDNIGFVVTGPATHYEFAALATNLLPNLHTLDTGQFFPRFTWEAVEAPEGELDLGSVTGGAGTTEASVYGQVGEVVGAYRRVDNITDEITAAYRSNLGEDVTRDDIFHFVYATLHDPDYREIYKADLKKMLPHIETPTDRARFDRYARAGKELIALHVGYEDVEPWQLEIKAKPGADLADRETWRVTKMRWAKKKDPKTGKNVNDTTRLIYNSKITVEGIPEAAERYQLGSRSAIAWLIDRYKVTRDKASGIVNDPNDRADEVGTPRSIVDLIGKVARVAVETMETVDKLGAEI